VFLLNDVVTARRRDHLRVVNVSQAGELPDRGSLTPELVGMHDLWDIVFSQQPDQEGFRRFAVPMAQFFGEEGSEFYAPFAEGLVEEWRPHGRPFTTMLT